MKYSDNAPERVKFDIGLLLALCIGTLAAWAFLVRPGLPTDTDAEIHIFRAEQVKDAILEGVFYPRWAPDFYYGNGYPIFNYYAPLAYHVSAYYSILTGTDVVAGTKFVLVVAAYLGTLGMYLFVRDRWGGEAGMVAAAAWGLSPYIVFLEPHARGEVAESLALGISPVVFWAFSRVCREGSLRYVAISAVSLASLIMSHPLAALAVYALLLGLMLSQLVISPLIDGDSGTVRARQAVPLVVTSLLLGLGLSATYWIPAGLERDAVRLDFYGSGHYDFRQHFIPIRDLVSPAIWVDLGAAFPEFRFSLGPVNVILGIIGALTVLYTRIRQSDAIYLSLATLFSIYLMTDASLGLWEIIPPMRFFQFPMRFLGPAALTLAPLAGLAVLWVKLIRIRWAVGAGAAAMIIGLFYSSLPLTYAPVWGEFGSVSTNRIVEEEVGGKWLGTTCCHDFLPIGVKVVPEPDPAIINQYSKGVRGVERFDRSELPAGTTIGVISSGPEHEKLVVKGAKAFDLKLHRFYFPGWEFTIDGDQKNLRVTEPDGRMLVHIPSGEHEVEVKLEATPARRLGSGISLSAACLLGLIIAKGWKNRLKVQDRQVATSPESIRLAVIALACMVILKAASDRMGWFRHRSTGREVVVSDNAYYATIETEVELLGFDVPVTTVLPEEVFEVTLYWRAINPPSRNYQVYVHLRGEDGRLWGQSDRLNPGGFPTTRWQVGKYVRDEHDVRVFAGTPTGNYEVHVGLWNREGDERYIAHDEHGLMLGDSVPLRVAVNVGRRR